MLPLTQTIERQTIERQIVDFSDFWNFKAYTRVAVVDDDMDP
jgi:hypothetical protein